MGNGGRTVAPPATSSGRFGSPGGAYSSPTGGGAGSSIARGAGAPQAGHEPSSPNSSGWHTFGSSGSGGGPACRAAGAPSPGAHTKARAPAPPWQAGAPQS